MDYNKKKEKVKDVLSLQRSFFNPKKAPARDMDFQFLMNEPEGGFSYYLSIKNKTCTLVKGRSPNPVCEVITDVKTWENIGGKYISPKDAMKTGKLKIKGRILTFILKYKKIFCGNLQPQISATEYTNPPSIERINNVLIVSCSPRGEKGATQLFADVLNKGMVRAGAEVETLLLSKMKIKPCAGCFNCWKGEMKCIHENKDDMKIFWDKYFKADLMVWATPIYVFHGTTLLKTVIDRFLRIVNPHISVLPKGELTHGRRNEHIPYEALLACGGLNDLDVFRPLQETIRTWVKYKNSVLLAELFRTNSMRFISEDTNHKIMDEALEALEQAGYELITLKKVKKRTKKKFERKIYSNSIFVSAANNRIEQIISGERAIAERKI